MSFIIVVFINGANSLYVLLPASHPPTSGIPFGFVVWVVVNALQLHPAGTLSDPITLVVFPHRKFDDIPVVSDCWELILNPLMFMLSEFNFCDPEVETEQMPDTEYFPLDTLVMRTVAEQLPDEGFEG